MTTNDSHAGWAPHDPEATLLAPAGSPPAAAPQAPVAPASAQAAAPAYAPPAQPAYAQAAAYAPPAQPGAPAYAPPQPGFGQPAQPPTGQPPLVPPAYAPQGQPGHPAQPVWSGPRSQPLAPVTNSSTAKIVATSVARSLIIRAVSFAVVAAIGLGLYWVFVVHKNSQTVKAALPPAGKCFSYVGDAAKVLPCTDPLAVYKSESVLTNGTTGTTACDAVGAYANFGLTSYIRNNAQSATVCGVLNLKVGDCVSQSGDAKTVPCASAGGDDEKVLSIKTVTSAQAATSNTTAMNTCGDDATDFLSDVSVPAILCMGKP